MKRSVYHLYKRTLIPFKRSFFYRSKIFYFFLALFIIISIGLLYLSNFAAGLVYEPEMSVIMPYTALILLMFIPAFLFLCLIVVFIKITVDWITKREGTRIRSKMLIYFFIATIGPSAAMTIIFNQMLNAAVDVFFKEEIVASLNESLSLLRDSIHRIKENTIRPLQYFADTHIRQGNEASVINFSPVLLSEYCGQSGLDAFFVYSDPGIQTASWSSLEENRKKISHSEIILHWRKAPEKPSVSYEIENNYVISFYPLADAHGRGAFLCGIIFTPPPYSENAKKMIEAIKRIRQFQLLREPLKTFIFFLYIYLYIPILAIGVIFFFYTSNRITRPLGKIAVAAQMIAHGDYSFTIHYSGEDEIKKLINSFNGMSEELLANREQIRRVSHITAWKDVAVRLAHEIKNPLTPILLAAETIDRTITQKHFETYKDLIDNFNMIYSQIDAMKLMIGEFSQFSREIKIKRIPCRITGIIQMLKNYLQQMSNVKTSVVISHDSSFVIKVDRQRIYQTMVNLIKNAWESITESGMRDGKITVTARINRKLSFPRYELIVEDNGPGIPESVKSKIFEPYYTTKPQGSGLGLAVCEQIAEGHNGKIIYESESGRTVFTLSIPVA